MAWAAVALSLVATGVGHIYCGQIAKGLLLFCAWFLVVPLVVAVALLPPSTASLVLLIITPALFLVLLHFFAAVDAFRIARRVGNDYHLRDYNKTAVYTALIVVGLVYRVGLTAGVRETSFEAFFIPTRSMSPNIVKGDHILVNKTLGRHSLPERGELIVFRPPEAGSSVFVKRVVGLPGDRVAVDDGELIINGQPRQRQEISAAGVYLDEPADALLLEHNGARSYRIQLQDAASLGEAALELRQMAEIQIPPRSVFVLGDNRDGARDSRSFGVVPVGDILGLVQYIHWPAGSWSRFGAIR